MKKKTLLLDIHGNNDNNICKPTVSSCHIVVIYYIPTTRRMYARIIRGPGWRVTRPFQCAFRVQLDYSTRSLLSIKVSAWPFWYIRRPTCWPSARPLISRPTSNPTPRSARFLQKHIHLNYGPLVGQIYYIALLSFSHGIETSSRLSTPNHGSII